MTKKERACLTNGHYAMKTLKANELAELYFMAGGGYTKYQTKQSKALIDGILLAYKLGYARAERTTKRQIKKKEKRN